MDKNKCWGICNETERLEDEIEELEKKLELVTVAYLLTINEILPDINCDNCKYKNNKYCKTEDCHKAIYHYFLDRAKE